MKLLSPARRSEGGLTAVRIAGIYAVVSAAWLLGSDYLVEVITGDPRFVSQFQTYKSWIFIIASVFVLYALIRYSEKKAQKRENRFRDLTEASSDWVWEMDQDLRFTFLSERFFGLTSVSPEQVLGRTWWELAGADIDRIVRQDHRELLELRRPFRDLVYPIPSTGDTGRLRYFKASGKPNFDTGGRFLGYRGTGTDVTIQVRAEMALRESQRALTTLMGNLPGMAYRCRNDRDWSMEFVSGGSYALTGYMPSDLIENRKLAFGELIHPEDQDPVWSEVQTAVVERRPFQLSYRIRSARGDEKWVWEQGCGVFSPDGDLQALEGLIIDITEQKEADQALLESEEHNRLIVDMALDAVITIALDGTIVGWNPQAESVFGFAQSEVLGQSLSETIIPQSYRAAHELGLKQFASTGRGPLLNTRFEITAMHRSGREFPIELAIVPLEAGKAVRFSAFVRDITERKQAEERLRRSEEQLRLTLESAPIGIATLDLGGRFLTVNPAFCDILGYSVDGLSTMSIRDITHPEDLDETIEQHQALVAGRISTYELRKRCLRKDFKVIDVRVRAGLVRDAHGKPLLVVAEVEDITEREHAVREMQRMRVYLLNMINSMPSILIGVDTEGRVTEWNTGAQRATGVSVDKAMGRSFVDLCPQLESQLDKVHEAINIQAPVHSERMVTEEEGQIRYSDVMVYPLMANHAVGAVIRVDDITDRVRIEQMMVETEKMMSMGGLAAGMAHEIKNPLSGVLQSCQNVVRRLSPELPANRETAQSLDLDLGQVQRYLEKRRIPAFLDAIREAGDRANLIVADMLSFSRGSSRELIPVRVEEMLETVVRLAGSDYDLKKKYDFKHIEIVRDFDRDLEPVPCDRTEIEQVLLNLVKNSAEAMIDADSPLPHRITLRTGREDDYACIDVEDNGPGMDEKTRGRVFEPFFTTKPVGRGTGLGLSVSYFIITEQHRGSISVSTKPGRGACFSVLLPLCGR